MSAVAGTLLAALLAADRQTVMLRAFWTLVVAAGVVSIGAWILLAREIRVQRRRRGDSADGDSADGDSADGDSADGDTAEGDIPARDGDGGGPAAHAVEVPADTADVGDPTDRS